MENKPTAFVARKATAAKSCLRSEGRACSRLRSPGGSVLTSPDGGPSRSTSESCRLGRQEASEHPADLPEIRLSGHRAVSLRLVPAGHEPRRGGVVAGRSRWRIQQSPGASLGSPPSSLSPEFLLYRIEMTITLPPLHPQSRRAGWMRLPLSEMRGHGSYRGVRTEHEFADSCHLHVRRAAFPSPRRELGTGAAVFTHHAI